MLSDATSIAAAVRQRQRSAREVVAEAFRQIDRWEPVIHAWAILDRVGAAEQAARIDAQIAAGIDPGPLAGVPVGVKDVIDVAGLPTTNGVPGGHLPARDAFVVGRLRAAGAIIIGKTVTAPFAFVDPPVTRNPYHPGRTPGGSSSGAGAAVGARTVPASLGTQTAGSTLRPASYCGAVGFKPSFGWTGRSGITPLAPSLDHVGVICRSVADAALFFDVLAAPDPADPDSASLPLGARQLLGRPVLPPRLGVVEPLLRRADEDTASRTREWLAQLERAGARLVSIDLPLDLLVAIQRVVMWAEGAAVHRDLTRLGEGLPTPRLRATLRVGALLPAEVLLRADRLRRRYRAQVAELLLGLDGLIMPTTTTAAGSPETTGDPTPLAPWSLLGLPAITLPAGLSQEGLPLGLQLVGAARNDGVLLRVAAWVEAQLEPLPAPTLPTEVAGGPIPRETS